MKTTRPHSTTRPAQVVRPRPPAAGDAPPEIPLRWRWHYQTLARLRERLIGERGEHLREAAEPVEPYSLHQADSATDEFDHEFALSQLSAEQDAIYEVEAAMQRIIAGGYGVCEQTGTRIPAARLKAVPWTRFREEQEARIERTGDTAPASRQGPLITG
ncbi:MAG: TraR/DksA C4-type zinc finger protein [Chthoniobacter sp.]|nr:TraR/DksA C4-type zinc finger protein [Chthoniobacter sp.]